MSAPPEVTQPLSIDPLLPPQMAAAGERVGVKKANMDTISMFVLAGLAGAMGEELSALTWGDFLVNNLLPVTIGNIIGGALLVGAVYWFVYLRPGTKVV